MSANPTPIGRFAPSPSGPLHMGSLLMALASYLHIKHLGGDWFIRMDDIDPPRSQEGAVTAILETLAAHGLNGDSPVQYQSGHDERYLDALTALSEHTYYCTCSRRQLRGISIYPGTCRDNRQPIEDAAIKVDTSAWAPLEIEDKFLGTYTAHAGKDFGDFTIRRRDGLWSYHLATAVDDGHDVTHVVRGQDLTDSTAPQVGLMNLLGLTAPVYSHLPNLKFADGQKLSKQHHATPVVDTDAASNLRTVLRILGQDPGDPARSSVPDLGTAISQWDMSRIPAQFQPFPRLDHDC